MKRTAPSLTRLFIIIAIAAAGYFGYTRLSSSAKFPDKLNSMFSFLLQKSPLKLDPNKIAQTAKSKLVDQQPIIEDKPESAIKPSVMGDSTTVVSQQAKEFVTLTTQKITTELQNLPKEQAAKLVRQTCDQIISELEK